MSLNPSNLSFQSCVAGFRSGLWLWLVQSRTSWMCPCVFRVFFLDNEPSDQSELLRALNQVLIKCFSFPLTPNSIPVHVLHLLNNSCLLNFVSHSESGDHWLHPRVFPRPFSKALINLRFGFYPDFTRGGVKSGQGNLSNIIEPNGRAHGQSSKVTTKS